MDSHEIQRNLMEFGGIQRNTIYSIGVHWIPLEYNAIYPFIHPFQQSNIFDFNLNTIFTLKSHHHHHHHHQQQQLHLSVYPLLLPFYSADQ